MFIPEAIEESITYSTSNCTYAAEQTLCPDTVEEGNTYMPMCVYSYYKYSITTIKMASIDHNST